MPTLKKLEHLTQPHHRSFFMRLAHGSYMSGEPEDHIILSSLSYNKPNVAATLRDLTDFIFFCPSQPKELVSLEDLSNRAISGSGKVVSHDPKDSKSSHNSLS